ncbi:FecR family protein [Larkinella rosea]|uniref:FecR family protein n=1 Tax=Larkinella rosea TaxID=2025312 RepID=A0A3P1BD56_9BACT|nr:FecR family protein [Larkinella rosea]RRA98964.1 FecR family protein [Larkinella rosea]
MYPHYTTDDFLQDTAFRKWVLQGEASDDAFWADVLLNHPNQRATIRQARELLLTLHERVETDFPSEQQVNTLYKRIWKSAQETSVRPWRQWPVWLAAASISLILGLGGWWFSRKNNHRISPDEPMGQIVSDRLEQVRNNTSSVLIVNLPDGSQASLEPRTQLQYRKAFADTIREVFLEGEAFFEVQKNPDKPFLVHANAITTKVLGTSFRVRAYDRDQQIQVMVKTGRVSVFPTQSTKHQDPEKDGLILTPNQQATFTKADAHITRTLVEKPAPILPPAEVKLFSFRNAPLAEILQAIEKTYGVEIIFDEEQLSNCRLTTSLGSENLFEKMDIICEAVGASYKLVDARIVVDSKGCD